MWAVRLGISSGPVKVYPNETLYVEEDVVSNVEALVAKLVTCSKTLDRIGKVRNSRWWT